MIALLVLAASPLLAEPPAQPPDFLAYMEEVRKAGATEDAQSALRTVAWIMVGDAIIEFPKDPETGGYGHSYRSTSCPAPGLSKEAREKLVADAVARTEPVLKRLREFADTDRSGFVSSREGWEVRLIFEFGAELADLVPKEGTDKAKLCKLLNVTPAEFDQRLEAYRSLVRWFAGMKVRYLPPIPAMDVAHGTPKSGLQ
ncbi:MAG TPA: hypothetical protein VMT19_11505 [Thermoanaerobaculaceae bacterium]|nr:hypothetical protein [Thermoanaerobaculaceae bacterium]